jgi:pullulanase/glycogen debranching enzyme
VNSIKWANKATHFDYFTKYQQMIALRKTTETMRLGTATEVGIQHSDLNDFGGLTFTTSTVGYRLNAYANSTDAYDEYVIIHNGNNAGVTLSTTGYTVVYVSSGSLTSSAATSIGANVSVVLAKNN